jgi:type 1 glutamine amidotransferase
MIHTGKYIYLTGLFVLAIIFLTGIGASAGPIKLKNIKVLVYTKNGKGFVHDNIASAVACIQKLGHEQGFKVDVSDDPAVFTADNLKQYTMLIFTSTNNDVFNTDEQRVAFRDYMEAGGGFVGIHSITGTERNWTWFKQMVGCTFVVHDVYQKFNVDVIAPNSPLVQGIPKVWQREDECYFGKEWYPGIIVVMADDISSLDAKRPDIHVKGVGSFGNLYPAVWYQHFDGGNIWITALGHAKENYSDPTFVTLILNGIKFIAGESKKLDFNKAYARERDAPVQY